MYERSNLLVAVDPVRVESELRESVAAANFLDEVRDLREPSSSREHEGVAVPDQADLATLGCKTRIENREHRHGGAAADRGNVEDVAVPSIAVTEGVGDGMK